MKSPHKETRDTEPTIQGTVKRKGVISGSAGQPHRGAVSPYSRGKVMAENESPDSAPSCSTQS